MQECLTYLRAALGDLVSVSVQYANIEVDTNSIWAHGLCYYPNLSFELSQ